SVSCGAIFYQYQRTTFPYSLLPGAEWAERAAIAAARGSELGGAPLLVHPRTRKLGALVAGVLLFLLGTNPVGRLYEFASIFLSLFTLGFTWPRLSLGRLGPPLAIAACAAISFFAAGDAA